MRLVLLVLMVFATAAPAVAAESHSPEDRYEQCLKHMQRAYYTKALEECNRVRNYNRDDPISVKAELAIADIYFKKGDYEQARLAYDDFARLHPRDPDLDYVVYRLGLSIYKRAARAAARDQTSTRRAVDTWSGFATRFPDSEHRDEVADLLAAGRRRLAVKELVIADYYAREGVWGAAVARAEGMLRRYPASEEAPRALATIARGRHAWGDVDGAAVARDRLASDYPDSPWLRRTDRRLQGTPGEPPPEVVFVRPYKVPAMMGPGTGAY